MFSCRVGLLLRLIHVNTTAASVVIFLTLYMICNKTYVFEKPVIRVNLLFLAPCKPPQRQTFVKKTSLAVSE